MKRRGRILRKDDSNDGMMEWWNDEKETSLASLASKNNIISIINIIKSIKR